MKNPFQHLDVKTLYQLNITSLIITALCEVFVIYIYLTKATLPYIERWKYIAIVIGLVVVSLLFAGALASMVLFIIMRRKKKQK